GCFVFFFSSRRRHTRFSRDWSSDVCSSDLVCMGQAASAAAVLLAAGAPGKRAALPHARVLLHQPSTEGQGEAADLEIQAAEILRVRAQIEDILARHTGQSTERLREDTDRDKIFTAEQAKEYGLIDGIIDARSLPARAA